MKKTKLHENLLNFLIDKKVVFMPRQTNRSNKLEEKYWFLTGEDYSCVSFWHGFDGDRKIPNISLIFGNSFPSNLEILLTGRSDSSSWKLFDKIEKRLSFKKENEGYRTKLLQKNIKDIEELTNAIEKFLVTEKIILDKEVSEHNHKKIKIISNDTFIQKIKNLNRFRSNQKLLRFENPNIIGEKKSKIVNGRLSKSEKAEIRQILAKKVLVEKKHNKMQNSLFSNLKNKFPQAYIIMEEDYIDLKVETSEDILLYEVKPYSSVVRCIKEAIGQLLGYYFNLSNPNEKKVKLIVYGPNKPNDHETEYLNFIRKRLNCNLSYEYQV